MEFEEDPDYDYLRRLFSTILVNIQEKNDLHFFWIINKKKFKKGDEDIYSESINIDYKRRGGSKNRLYKKIKSSLEKKGSQEKESKDSSLQLDHVINLNFRKAKSQYQSINNKINIEYDNNNKISDNSQKSKNICFNISDYNNKYACNFKDNIYNNSKDSIDKNKLVENKLNNNNKKAINDMKDNTNNKNILYNRLCYKNNISALDKNHIFQFSNQYLTFNNLNLNSILNNEENNLRNINVSNKEYFFTDSNEKKKIIKKKISDKKIFIKKNNKYKTLNERKKEKESYNYMHHSDIKKNNFCSALDNYNSINLNNNNDINNKMSLIDKNTVKNICQENIKNNNNIYNNVIKNSILIIKNMKDSGEKQNLFNNNTFNKFQNNKNKLFKTSNNTYQVSPKKMINHSAWKNSDAQIDLEPNTKLFGKRIVTSLEVNLEERKNYSKYNINDNSPYKKGNDIFSANNNIIYRNLNSFNNGIINNNNDKKISFSQLSEKIQFSKFLEKEYNDKKKSFHKFKIISNDIKFKNNLRMNKI